MHLPRTDVLPARLKSYTAPHLALAPFKRCHISPTHPKGNKVFGVSSWQGSCRACGATGFNSHQFFGYPVAPQPKVVPAILNLSPIIHFTSISFYKSCRHQPVMPLAASSIRHHGSLLCPGGSHSCIPATFHLAASPTFAGMSSLVFNACHHTAHWAQLPSVHSASCIRASPCPPAAHFWLACGSPPAAGLSWFLQSTHAQHL